MIQFGVITLQNIPWKEELARWQEIESQSFDSIWIADHFVDFTKPENPWFEAWTLLAALASYTRRIRIGTLVTNVFWRNPVFLARQAMTLDHISQGRLELGLGVGGGAELDPTYRMTGLKDWSPKERVNRFKEILELLDSLLVNETTEYVGKFYKIHEAVINPKPIQQPRPPFTIGALGKRMLKLTARYADTWNTFGGDGLSPLQMYEKIKSDNAFLDDYCLKIDRDPHSLRRSILFYGNEAWTMYDSLDNFRVLVEKYAEIGISEFIIYYPWAKKQIKIFEKIAQEIIPELIEEIKG